MARILPIAVVGLALVLYALWRGAYPDLFEEAGAPPAETATAPAVEAPADPETPPDASVATPEQAPAKPQLDVVRIDKDGDTVIAGKAEPGATVTVTTQDGPLAEAKADEHGNWVALPDKPLPEGDHAVKIEATGKNGRTEVGDKTIVVSIPEPGKDEKPLVIAVPSGDFGVSEVLQRPETPPTDRPAAPEKPEKPVVVAEAGSQQADAAGEGTASGGEADRPAAAASDEAAPRESGVERPSGTVARAPAPGKPAVAAPGSVTPSAGEQAAIGKDAPADAKTADKDSGTPSTGQQVSAGKGEETAVAAGTPDKPKRTGKDEDPVTPSTGQRAADDKAAPAAVKSEDASVAAKAPDKPKPAEKAEGSTAPSAGRQAAATGDAAMPEGKRDDPAATVAGAPAKPVTDEPPKAGAAPAAVAGKARDESQPAAPKSGEKTPAAVAAAPAAPSVPAPGAGQEAESGTETSAPSADRAEAAPSATAAAPAAPAPEGQQAKAGPQSSSGGVSVDSVDYDDKGNLALAGKAKPGSVVEPKIAGKDAGQESLGETRADEKGEWSIRVDKPVAPGRYDLTVEERTPEGAPRSRIRLPFERADPITDFPPGDIVVVQPGNSLWRIARRIYGQGVRYTVIYAANQAQIGNPDLIFPGQIFSVPQENRPGRTSG